MVKSDFGSKYDLSSLTDVMVTGSILSESIAIAFIKKFNIKYLRQLYGTTEVSTCVMQRKDDLPNENLRCAGSLVPGYSVKIVDRKLGIPLGPNCVGELYTKGPSVMSGFLNMRQENLEAFDENGYYKTGDAAYYDFDGRIFIVDRYKNILKFEGGAVSCAELECILITHSQIKEVSVIAVEHEVYGEVPRALIVVDHGQLSSKDVMDYMDNHVYDYKRLYGGVVFVNKIPKSNFGKVNRRALLAMSSD